MQAEFFDRRMSDAPDAEPVIEDPKRPRMTDQPPRPRRIAGKVVSMAKEPEKPASTERNRMRPVPPPTTEPEDQRLPTEDQAEAPRPAGTAVKAEGYVRVRVRVQDDRLTVQDLRRVEGPLEAHESLHGDFAYEATLGGKRLASGAVPDAGVNRSFPNPDPASGQDGHNFEPASYFDVLVRIPADAITLRSLPRLNIALYRIKEGPLPRTDDGESLDKRFSNQLREVGRIRGIDLAELPREAQAQARRALE